METLEYIAMQKMISTPEIVCGHQSKALLTFVQNVYSLQFDEAPKYNDLALILQNNIKLMKNVETVPNYIDK